MNRKLSIKDWAIENRPREKLMSRGIGSLTNAELLAILIRSGNRDETAVDVAMKILEQVNQNLNELGKQSIHDLKKQKGIGEAKALSIVAALELGRRRKIEDVLDKQKITSSNDVYKLFQPLLGDLLNEEFWVLFLNRANKIIENERISIGGVAGTVIDVKIILKSAIEKLASSIILCHNHPSGNIQPSESDVSITKKLLEAGKVMDIEVLDHIIIADSQYFSFADEGRI